MSHSLREAIEALQRASPELAPELRAKGIIDDVLSACADGPVVLVELLEALATGQSGSRPMDDGDLGWSWLFWEFASIVPGAEAHADSLWLGARGIWIDHVTRTSKVGVRPAPPSSTPRLESTPYGTELVFVAEVRALLRSCEVHCLAGCCGIGAFDIAPIHVRQWLTQIEQTVADRAATELDAAIELARRATDRVRASESRPLRAPPRHCPRSACRVPGR